MSKDAFVIRRPSFRLNRVEKIKQIASQLEGRPYDWSFDTSLDALTCAEGVQAVLIGCHGTSIPFTSRRVFGVFTVHPQDFVDAHDKFHTVLCVSQKTKECP
jgi:hypothetical protein